MEVWNGPAESRFVSFFSVKFQANHNILNRGSFKGIRNGLVNQVKELNVFSSGSLVRPVKN